MAASTGAIPTVPTAMPSPAAIKPLNILPFEIVTTNTIDAVHKEKYSQGPSLIAILASGAQTSIAIKTLVKVAIKLENMPTPNALLACPFFAIVYPSYTVARFAFVPGIPSRIAEINPPETPPQYILAMKIIAVVALIAKDTGRSKVIAVFAPMPGIAPNMMPMMTPLTRKNRLMGVNKPCNTSINIVIVSFRIVFPVESGQE